MNNDMQKTLYHVVVDLEDYETRLNAASAALGSALEYGEASKEQGGLILAASIVIWDLQREIAETVDRISPEAGIKTA